MDFGAGDSNDKGAGGRVAAVSGNRAHRANYRASTANRRISSILPKLCTEVAVQPAIITQRRRCIWTVGGGGPCLSDPVRKQPPFFELTLPRLLIG
jgi:hypothetical protein